MPRLLMERDCSFKHRAPFPKIGDVAAQLRVRFGVDGTRATIPLHARGQRGSFVAALSAIAEEAPDRNIPRSSFRRHHDALRTRTIKRDETPSAR